MRRAPAESIDAGLSKTLVKHTHYVIVTSFVIAAVITPTPDPINQTIMALPIILLYALSVLPIWIIFKPRGKGHHGFLNSAMRK